MAGGSHTAWPGRRRRGRRACRTSDGERTPAHRDRKRLVPRDGAAQPGEYVTIVYSGPMQVRVTVPARPNWLLARGSAAAADGAARPLQTRTVEGMVVAEGAPVLGVALESAQVTAWCGCSSTRSSFNGM